MTLYNGTLMAPIIEILVNAKNPNYHRYVRRLKRCRDPNFPRCGVPLLCPRCARRRKKRFREEIISIAPTLESEANAAIELESNGIIDIRRRISDLSNGLPPGPSKTALDFDLTERKKHQRGNLMQISRDVRDLKAIRTDDIVLQLKKATKAFRDPGEINPQPVADCLLQARRLLRWRLNHSWRILWLTMPYTFPTIVNEIDIAKRTFRAFWKTYLSGPYCSAFLVTEIANGHRRNGHVHQNCIYYGPSLPADEFQNRWVSVGGGPVMSSKKFRFGRNNSLKGLVNYSFKYPWDVDPVFRVAYWEAAVGRHLAARYGGFRRRRPKK